MNLTIQYNQHKDINNIKHTTQDNEKKEKIFHSDLG